MGDHYLPLRLRVARIVNRAIWRAIFALPRRVQGWFVGDDPWEPRYVRWLCRPCHDLVHRQPLMAYSLGLSVRRNTNRTETT